MSLDPGTYDVEYIQGGVVQSTGELTIDGTPTPNVFQTHLTTADYGITPSSNLSTNVTNLQNFIDHVTTNNLIGVIDAGTWNVNTTLFLRNGTRLVGRGMHKTIINAPEGSWVPSDYYLFRLQSSDGTNDEGLYLADMQCVGADKNRTDSGPLVRIEACYNFVIERMMVVDASSYGIYITGYDYSKYPTYSDDITTALWNNTHRGTVRDCLAIRGQIGFGTEGEAENLLFHRCTSIGNYETSGWGLHGFRSASGINITYDTCRAFGYRNGFLIERYSSICYTGCHIEQCRNGIILGGYYNSDPKVAHAVRIIGNHFNCSVEPGTTTAPSGINDFYLSPRRVEGVVIQGNTFRGDGGIRLGQSRNVSVQGNITTDGQAGINTSHGATGLIANNVMQITAQASGIVDGGNNIASNLT